MVPRSLARRLRLGWDLGPGFYLIQPLDPETRTPGMVATEVSGVIHGAQTMMPGV